jgi:hypothetical protein
MERNRPSVSRDTRLLFAVILISVAMLWVLARIRFPDRPATPNPVPPVLAQLVPSSAFDDMAASVAQLEPRLRESVVALDVWRQSGAVTHSDGGVVPALRFRDDLAVALMRPAAEALAVTAVSGTEVARDPVSHLAVIRVPEGFAPALSVSSPRRFDYPRFFLAADTTRDGMSLRPVFIGSLNPITSPTWAAPIWALPGSSEIAAGTFVFTIDGEFAGLVVERDGRHAIVPAETVLAVADRLAREGPGRPGHLGIRAQALTPDLAAASGASLGAVVAWVDPVGPAAKQIQATDIIEGVGDEAMTTLEHWEARQSRLAEGEAVVLKVRRSGQLREVPLTAAAVPPPARTASLGLTLRAIPRIGVEVVSVEPGSAAFRAGIQARDIITRFGEVDAPSATQVSRAFGAAADDRPVVAAVTRGDAHLVVALERVR